VGPSNSDWRSHHDLSAANRPEPFAAAPAADASCRRPCSDGARFLSSPKRVTLQVCLAYQLRKARAGSTISWHVSLRFPMMNSFDCWMQSGRSISTGSSCPSRSAPDTASPPDNRPRSRVRIGRSASGGPGSRQVRSVCAPELSRSGSPLLRHHLPLLPILRRPAEHGEGLIVGEFAVAHEDADGFTDDRGGSPPDPRCRR
jgi:hypothetical protein